MTAAKESAPADTAASQKRAQDSADTRSAILYRSLVLYSDGSIPIDFGADIG
ncbi:hypothetical protein L917_11103 [Phytophthora nicotianae]|uniref:Uncharacterized protein n=1 Tax=Phytophthora nicotianae TaxID=4792 RepID=W2N6M7_PHYNI|nr:hypothetical protein L915_11299 [Phytophthora nicotianae]ETL36905.1 hypothetical protein L916_11200 [Phytophthora nicotianae]ETL90079.1 hypothetical protein L917_11103 [Phytophthora nicotianae]ETM43369.1 hypothetical protein L914_11135 [Phytophthora nicotianae]